MTNSLDPEAPVLTDREELALRALCRMKMDKTFSYDFETAAFDKWCDDFTIDERGGAWGFYNTVNFNASMRRIRRQHA